MKEMQHPSISLIELMKDKNMSQRDLSSIIQLSPSVLNNILVNKKPFTAELSVKLEAVGLGRAKDWLVKQAMYDIVETEKSLSEEAALIKIWNNIQKIIPISYFRKKKIIESDIKSNIKSIFKLYDVQDFDKFYEYHQDYVFSHYRKSQAFSEQKNNVIAWSTYAEYIVKNIKVKKFSLNNQDNLIKELNILFLKNNKNLIEDTKKTLSNYGIKFETLDRPSKTPVDGKSFMSNGVPSIVLSLKYKRLDNFAFTIMHELGHVFLHLTGDYQGHSFFINSSKNDTLEFEANQFARNKLIPESEWEYFEIANNIFTDDVILNFAKKIKVHPAIVRGRVCFEHNKYYRRKSSITSTNIISD
ncbi:ImmA/IrrE family metallo-endopeptidase [Polaribacter sp.]|uniref:ImmA/IrrE family metallo-endopeptidase n=1 Tax=Polaribacter sp. TaxID=1920175 RepID=UPI003EF549E1